MLRKSILLLLPFVFCSKSLGQTSSVVENGQKRSVKWKDLAEKVVTVDGLAWGAFAKGIGQHLVLPHGRVYVRGVNFRRHDLNGRLLRVTGVLRMERMPAAPAGVQGYGQAFDYFVIEALSAEQIEKVERDQLLPSKADWVYVGMATGDAVQLMAKRKLPHHPLSISDATDGSTAHSHRINNEETLFFESLNGRVKSVTKIKHRGRGKADDEWTPVKGYRLPVEQGK